MCILHVPLHASGNVLQTCIVDTYATCRVWHSDAGGAPATGTLQWRHLSRMEQLEACPVTQTNREYPTVVAGKIQNK